MSESFDVVIVGAGAAGCVLAARLAESSSRSVLLLEAGPDLRAEVPTDLRDGWGLPREPFDWGYRSEPGPGGEPARVWRKRLVGGTSWLTRFVVRGDPADFDGWAARGNTGWGWDDVLPYFVRVESDADFGKQPWHGDAGPLPVDRYLGYDLTEMGQAAMGGLEASGFPPIEDHNRPGAIGAGRMPMNTRDGLRVTTADAYLPPDGTPANLVIRPDSQVADLVFDGTAAQGVRLVDGSTVDAGWVVLSAGTYGSPSILMRSGVGPADHLRELGIPVIADLSGVGANLGDHPSAWIEAPFPGEVRETPLLHTIATFHSNSSSPDAPPDLVLWIAEPSGDPAMFEIDVLLMKPNSRGTVRLRSADPMDPPVIRLPDPNSEPSDMDRLIEGCRRALEVAGQPEVRALCPELGAGVPTEAGLRDYINQNRYSVPHVVGACAMGPSPDAGAVVDASGRVHGTERLSVVDASIIPEPTAGFPHVVAIMLAERLAEEVAASI
jgi:choline dehydrogenase